jgi:SAM-dependent methyltransferase
VTRDAPRPPAEVIDTTRPSVARVYDYFLGGKDNYEVDRQVFGKVDSVAERMSHLARANRSWLLRVTRFLAGSAGIDQFLDLGAGLPAAENTHQAAQRTNPDARVVYVDNDLVVAAHGRALLEENDRTHLLMADFTKPDEILAEPLIRRCFDLTRPVGLILSGTMHHVADEQGPWDIMRRYVELLPQGSYLALSHFHDPGDGGEASELARSVAEIFAGSAIGPGHFRARVEIERFFDGLELVEPGVTRLNDWWPDGPLGAGDPVVDQIALGGVARKP